MKILTKILFISLALFAPACATAQEHAPRQGQDAIRQLVEQFLTLQASEIPGQVTVNVGAIDPRLNVAACAAPTAALSNGSRAWGKTTVVVRCVVPTPWTLYVTANVHIQGEYIATAAPLAAGQIVSAGDLIKMTGDLGALPAGVLTNPTQAIGRTVTNALKAGMPLRQESLRTQQVVQQGQTVQVISGGIGYKVSTEAKALSNAAEGQMAQARTANGQVVSGVARSGGVLQIN